MMHYEEEMNTNIRWSNINDCLIYCISHTFVLYTLFSGKYFFVDCGFANRCQFLAPLCGVRYHLKDFDGEGRHPKNANDLFNLRHSSLRNVVE